MHLRCINDKGFALRFKDMHLNNRQYFTKLIGHFRKYPRIIVVIIIYFYKKRSILVKCKHQRGKLFL